MTMTQQVTAATHTETIDLPSKGWFYPPSSPLSKGTIDLYYMTAKHEDILTSRNLIARGVVIDKLLEALIATPGVKLDDLILCDKSAIMMAARILGYGKEYKASLDCPSCDKKIVQEVNLEEFGDKECNLFVEENRGKNEFTFKLPVSGITVVYKYLTHADEKNIKVEIDGVKKAFKSDVSRESTTRLRYSILAVNGDSEPEKIRTFVDSMFARDANALREYVKETTPNVDLDINIQCENCGYEGRAEMPIGLNFFWPNARV